MKTKQCKVNVYVDVKGMVVFAIQLFVPSYSLYLLRA